MARYRELVIAGHYDLARGFVTGFLSGRTFPIPAVFSREHGIRRISLGEKVLTWTGMHEHVAHVIVEEQIAGDLIRELTTAVSGLGLKVVSNRRIKTAGFGFHYRVFARVYGEEIRKIFDGAGSKVKVTFEEGPEETVHPDAKGAEMYTPDHQYSLQASGSATGEFSDILAFFEKLREHPLVNVDEVVLEYEA